MIADNSNASAVSFADQKWMNEEWFPQAFVKGFRISAVVVAKDIFRDIAVKSIVNQMDKEKFMVQYFENVEDAKEYLCEIESFQNEKKAI